MIPSPVRPVLLKQKEGRKLPGVLKKSIDV